MLTGRTVLLACVATSVAPMGCDPQLSQHPAGHEPNFSLPADGSAPGAPATVDDKACAEQVFRAERLPLDVYFLMDATGSMSAKVGAAGVKWTLVRDAIIDFVMDPKSAELGAGLNVFPLTAPACQKDSDCAGTSKGTCLIYRNDSKCVVDLCDSNDYSSPLVDISILPGSVGKLVAALESENPAGGNNDAAALAGTFVYLQKHAAANPGRRSVLLYVTDGLPLSDGCNKNSEDAAIAEIRKGRTERPFVSTYVIGVYGPEEKEYAQITQTFKTYAWAGGTAAPFIVETRADLRSKFLETLSKIRDSALPCEYPIPAATGSAGLDLGRVNLSFTAADGQKAIIGNVPDASSCNPTRGGWYYDASPSSGATPTTVVACPLTCERFNQGPTTGLGRVEIRIGCKTVLIE